MNENKRIITSLIVVSCLLLILVSDLLFFNLFEAGEIRQKNAVMNENSERVFLKRGRILDRNKQIIAESVKDEDGTLLRKYPYGNYFSGVVGYYYTEGNIGKKFLEESYDKELMMKSDTSVFNADMSGDDLELTIDAKFQEYVYEQMGNYKGAIVAMNPKTGEILAMVSLPDFDPSDKVDLTERLEKDQKHIFLNMNALEPEFPGSTFKIITAAAAIENGVDGYYNDTGSFSKEGMQPIPNHDNKGHGKIDLKMAFKQSYNTYFCNVAYEVGIEKMQEICRRFGFDEEIMLDGLPVRNSTIFAELDDGTPYSSRTHCASLGIGQTLVKATPLHMAMICSTIANDGVMMYPYVVKNGKSEKADRAKKVIEKDVANQIGGLMETVVTQGTGKNAQIKGVTVAGKTGTAEAGKDGVDNDDHAWFVGYAPAENPKIAVAVFCEEAGGEGGGKAAAPIAQKVMSEYLNKYSGK